MSTLLEKLDLLRSDVQRVTDTQWEYRLMQRNRLEQLEPRLAELGDAGWELVGVTRDEGFVFKRRKGRASSDARP
ncbi:hypothetical protein MAIT1_04440 [Magnetofaba australis IT-1]|uniref:DUF4177 domain-containing protein n=2 Tax=Magnetofaba TaxID=1472292 RepID=A0A1Y2K9Z6_9PROT|nr:hypothetical protein MAIT1_04440 [Magnetofaba australis IT-1]